MFIVSSTEDIAQSARVLVSEGWQVMLGEGFLISVETMQEFPWVIVVAHGNETGEVFMTTCPDIDGPWISPQMELDSLGCRMYLYCCCAGKNLVPRFWDDELFGHVDKVPMPISGRESDLVTRFLHLVYETVSQDAFDRKVWQAKFMDFLDESLGRLESVPVKDDVPMDDYYAVHMLRKSLGNGKPMWTRE